MHQRMVLIPVANDIIFLFFLAKEISAKESECGETRIFYIEEAILNIKH